MSETPVQFSHLVSVYLPIAGVVFGIVVVALIVVLVRFRYRSGRAPSRRSEANRLELAYVLLLAVVVGVLVTVTFRSESQVDAVSASPALRVTAIGSDWRWRFEYPGLGIDQVGQGETPTALYVPAGRPVEFDLTSLDVIHAFYVPDEDFQRAAIPKIVNRFDLVFPTPGVEHGECNEYCGIGHTLMRFEVHVLTAAKFATWVSECRQQGGGR